MNRLNISSPKPWARNLKSLLKILNDGNYHSGEDLGEKLHITRSAIWKLIKQLKNFGIEIKAKTNLGYIIPGGLELLNKKKITEHIPYFPTKKILIFDEIDSTNNYLYELIKNNRNLNNEGCVDKDCEQQSRDSKSEGYVYPSNLRNRRGGKERATGMYKDIHEDCERHSQQSRSSKSEGYICMAETQTAGKGRLGRRWHSPYAQNIYLSLTRQFYKEPLELSNLGLIVAVTIIEALEKYGINKNLALKWPNDVLWNGKKLAGILVELFGEANSIYNAIIGIGLNIKMDPEAKKAINQPWCDIYEITNTTPSRNKLAGLLLDQIITAIEIYKNKGLKPFIKTWLKFDAAYNKKITIYTPQEKISGIGLGIDDNGHLLLKDNRGKMRSFASGEVSLRFEQ